MGLRQGYASSNNYTVYYYITNLQGDVIRLVDVYGNTAAYYEYDPYGNAIKASGSHANINPLRYRAYVYDSESGFYYLQSRYYDPELGRFINADAFASTGQGILGNNMFAYCNNNPAIYADPEGNLPGGIINPNAMARNSGCSLHPISDKDRLRDQAKKLTNSSEEAVLAAEHYAFYNGVLVVRTNGDRSGSFGVIFLTRETNTRSYPEDMVRHEYGHIKQLEQLGVAKYFLCIFIPSWQKWGSKDYYNKPWEITADILGSVQSRPHTNGDISEGFAYLDASSRLGPLVWMFIE